MSYADRTWSNPCLSFSCEIKEGIASALAQGNDVPVEFEVTVGSETAVDSGEPRPAELIVDTPAGIVGDTLIDLRKANTAEWQGRIVGPPEEEHGILARLNASDGEEITRERIRIPPIVLLADVERIRQSGLDDELIERLSDRGFGADRFEISRRIQATVRELLPDDEYYELVATLANADDRFQEWWTPARHFHTRVVSWGPPRSVDALRDALQAHNGQDTLPDITLGEALSQVVREFQSLEETTANRLRETFGRIELCTATESEDLLLHELAVAVQDEQYDQVPALVERLVEVWSESVSTDDEYKSRKERARTADTDDRATAWLEVLVDALERGRNERRYVLANVLYWTGRTRRAELSCSAKLQTAAAELLGTIDADTFSLRASFNAQVDRGHTALYDDNATAADEFTVALSYAAAPAADWNGVDTDYVYAYTMAVVAEVRRYVDEGANSQALELITREREAIENPTKSESREVLATEPGAPQAFRAVSTDTRRDQLTRLEAEQNRVEAKVAAYQGDFTSAIESAQNAQEQYTQLSANRARFAAYKFELILKAVRHERNLQFETARGVYNDGALSGRMARVRGELCRIKHALLNREYETAREAIRSLDANRLESSEVAILDVMIRLLSDYDENQITDPERVTETLRDPVASFTGFDLPVGTNYRVVVLLTAAAQHVQDSPIDDELLDLLIQMALRDALVPTLATEPTAGDYLEDALEPELEDLSIEETRHRILPLPVVDLLNRAEVDIATGTSPKGVGIGFWNALELAAKLSAEYHIKTELTSRKWREDVAGEGFAVTVENLFKNEDGLHNDRLERVTELRELTQDGQESDEPTAQYIRNRMVVHPEKPIDTDELSTFREQIIELLDDIAPALPVVCTVDDTARNGYVIDLHWNRPRTKAFLSTDAELQEDTVYYLPPEQVTADYIEIPASEIATCENELVSAHVNELS